MKKYFIGITQSVLVLASLFSLSAVQPAMAAEGTISETDKYAWSENAGWTNWNDTHSSVTVEEAYLTGYVWAENIGWIKLGTDGGGPYVNTGPDNWGVNRNSATGALSGYAWSENAGWINFSPTNSQVTVDPITGMFDGYAWGENTGYIHFHNDSPAYSVRQDSGLVTTPIPTLNDWGRFAFIIILATLAIRTMRGKKKRTADL